LQCKNIGAKYTNVWPGDANNNGLVEITDFLNICVGYDSMGPTRPSASLTWSAQPSPVWRTSFSNGVNYNFADVNGDGIIDYPDIEAISLNWSETHNKTGQSAQGNPANPPLYLQFAKDTFKAGDTVQANIMLGTSANPIQSIYGLAFTLNFSSKFVDSGSVAVSVPSSWLGTAGTNLTSLVHTDYINNQIAIGISRYDHKDVSGYGQIATMDIVMPDNIAGKTFTGSVMFKAIQVTAIQADETPVPIFMPEDSFTAFQVLGISPIKNNVSGVNIYPNPAQDNLYIDAGNHVIISATVFDALGNEVMPILMKQGQTTILPVNTLPQGVYMVRLILDSGEYVTRFVKD